MDTVVIQETAAKTVRGLGCQDDEAVAVSAFSIWTVCISLHLRLESNR